MNSFNVIELASIRQRRTAQKVGQAALADRSTPWRNRYRDGIDGLVSMRRLRASEGEVVPFVPRGCHPPANTN